MIMNKTTTVTPTIINKLRIKEKERKSTGIRLPVRENVISY